MSRSADAVRIVPGWLVRGGLFALWALVGWGSLLLALTVVASVREGPGPALARLLPSPGASAWAWVNGLAAALAFVAWLVLVGLVVARRRGSARSPRSSDEPAPERGAPGELPGPPPRS